MLKAAGISVTSVNFYQNIRPNNPEDSHLHIMLFMKLTDVCIYFYSMLKCLHVSLSISKLMHVTKLQLPTDS